MSDPEATDRAAVRAASFGVRRSALRSLSFGEAVLVALAAFALHGALHWGAGLYDTDGYTHLGLARAYAEEGIPHRVETARFSVMHDGFGDKEWLFHALLVPAVLWFSPLAAGHISLIAFNVLLALVLAALGRFLIGRWGLLLPFVLPLLSLETAWRLVRLRPELLALTLMLVALVFLAERRPWWLAATVFLFTWSYTAFHALVGVLLLAGLLLAMRRRSAGLGVDLRLLLAPPLGAAAGLVLHPHFPHNLTIWVIQNVQFFRAKNVLDAGTEIRPNLTSVMLQTNLGWWLALLVVLGAAVRVAGATEGEIRSSDERDRLARLTICFGTAAVIFVVLYLLMSRFSLYAFPLTTLALLSGLREGGWGLGPRWRVRLLGTVPTWALVVVVTLVAVGLGAREASRFRERTDLGPDRARLTEWARIHDLLPRDAHVAADWRTTGVLGYWAPARYLNLLDPVFMAQPHPERHAVLRSVLGGEEPDLVAALQGPLDSEVLAVSVARAPRQLLERVRSDPRLEVLHDGTYLLARVGPPQNSTLAWLDAEWSGTAGTLGPIRVRDTPTGFVGAESFRSEADCFSVSKEVTWPPSAVGLEFAPNGPGRLSWDGRVLVALQAGVHAVHSRGIRIPLPTGDDAGAEVAGGLLEVTTCTPSNGTRAGFYLRVL